jgi:prepilin-type N-terminal cleavage/methylation domain-containing protein
MSRLRLSSRNARWSRRPRPTGFTLVELLVGVVVAGFVAGATATAVSQLARAKARSEARLVAHDRAHAAAARMAHDALSAIRDHDLRFAKVQVIDEGAGALGDQLLVFIRSIRPVRGLPGVPEGGDFEVQYRLEPDPDAAGRAVLWRRSDVALDSNPYGGGVAVPLMSGVRTLRIEATDGQSWLPVWDSDFDGLPHGLRITVTASDDDGRFTATARRVVAIDRVPLPLDADADAAQGGAR